MSILLTALFMYQITALILILWNVLKISRLSITPNRVWRIKLIAVSLVGVLTVYQYINGKYDLFGSAIWCTAATFYMVAYIRTYKIVKEKDEGIY